MSRRLTLIVTDSDGLDSEDHASEGSNSPAPVSPQQLIPGGGGAAGMLGVDGENGSEGSSRMKRRSSLRAVSLDESSSSSGKPKMVRRGLNRSIVSASGSGLSGGDSSAGPSGDEDEDTDGETSTTASLLQDTVRLVLDKAPKDRTPDEVKSLVKDLEILSAFAALKTTARRELCAAMTLRLFAESNQIIDLVDEYCNPQWFAVIRGSVDVVVDGDILCTIKEGECFGHQPFVVEGVRRTDATIMTREDSCELVTVSLEEYERILKLVESNTTRVEEGGKVVLVLEKRTAADSSGETVNELIVTATVDKLIERLVLDEQHVSDKFYVSDFFLTYRTFISSEEVINRLLARLAQPACTKQVNGASRSEAQVIAFVVLFWLHNHAAIDFAGKLPMLDALAKFEGYLNKYEMNREVRQLASAKESTGLVPKSAETQTLTKSLSIDNADPKAMANLFKRKSSFAGRFLGRGKDTEKGIATALGGALAMVNGGTPSPSSPLVEAAAAEGDMDVIKIYRHDLTHKFLLVRKNTTAQEVVVQAVEQFGIKAKHENEYSLMQVFVSEKQSMVRPTQDNLAASLSINARFYLRYNLNPERFPAPESIAIEGESQLLNMEPLDVARELTILDSQLFRDIQVQEYVEHLFKLGIAQTDALNKFVDRFNMINFWVVNEIVMTRDVKRRVDVIKAFVAIGKHLRTFKNYNSLFAIVSGLSNTASTRLKETWEKVPKRVSESLKELEALMNPSRNMGIYRALLADSSAPMTPFFPLLIKDLVFIHEGNPSKVDGMINFEKLRMIARTLRTISDMCLIAYESDDFGDANSKDGRGTVRGGGTSSSSVFRKMYEQGRMKYYIIEYFRDLKVERDQVKLNEGAALLEKGAGTVRRSSPNVQLQ
ncbi:rap guanine nucleotide exchange factor 4 [Capsaspora owczarzaki ATCC 30864]|uniref:Rap guanine nucleotide exchange factor 4 n=1 Tax=Capsaspora owczarzaki (strain ATCC 30864) TaxID=595528 RepID=A0A0D2X4N6_CAPO3|nr:rap guanine nucleotide exchange factor 4 [Capsaspora owczarzaki ATCC 30864]KJE96374.1 rap guanine nucleotide exchange factor 4 [Capsaspora owczarzaki ATCC 30864]|eukprot:XP_004344331.1 rap guanine nucleotide exchange factor 4 [Capsaspora owczarzaki ATCC 30864]